VVSLVALLLFGIGVLLLLSFIKFEGTDTAWEFGRDLGIALIISAVVGGLFEVYRSARHQVETMRDVIDVTMGEEITPEVWLELKELIEQRKIIRRDVHIRWSLKREPSLQAPDAVLQIEQEYELHALTAKGGDFIIEHELDYHLSNQQCQLPRFERIVIDPPGGDALVFEGEDLLQKCERGKLSVKVSLQGRGGDPVRVRIERQELVHAPGSYNLYTPEFIKGLYIHYGDCPPEIDPEVLVRPLGPGLKLKHVGNNWSCEHLLLPGQGVEIKFLDRTVENPAKPNGVDETLIRWFCKLLQKLHSKLSRLLLPTLA
jgi:hypothetical protein